MSTVNVRHGTTTGGSLLIPFHPLLSFFSRFRCLSVEEGGDFRDISTRLAARRGRGSSSLVTCV